MESLGKNATFEGKTIHANTKRLSRTNTGKALSSSAGKTAMGNSINTKAL